MTDSPERALVFSGHLVQAYRELNGDDRHELGAAIGKSWHTIVSYELGRAQPRANDLPLLAEALGVEIADLFDTPQATAAIIEMRDIGTDNLDDPKVAARRSELMDIIAPVAP